MKLTKNNQKGFTIVEVLIIVVVIVVIGAIGYLFMSRQADNNERKTITQTTTTSPSENAKEETAQIKTDLESVDIDQATDTSDIDESLQ